MGQKVHPKGLRLGIIKTWDSIWYAEKDYAELLHEDIQIRKFIKENLKGAGISKIEIERKSNRIIITIHTAKPGMVIGKLGTGKEKLKEEIEKLLNKNLENKGKSKVTKFQVSINAKEIPQPDLDAQLVAENIAFQIEKRISYRRAMKQAVMKAMRLGAKGIKVLCSGRLAGAEIARHEGYKEGKIPLHTLRADIDYGFAEALTTYGRIGVKVWIYKGDIIPQKEQEKKEVEKNVNAKESEIQEDTSG